MDVAKLKEDWIGLEFDSVEFEMKQEEMLAFAETVGEQHPASRIPSIRTFRLP